jgi:LysR family transcriptional regulator, hydrogen peroxide-inducible genes activator
VDLSQVTLQQMRYALAVLETQNFRMAATRCAVSQSGLSMQLQKLEELLGAVLFDRTRQPVLPTAEGAKVLPQIRAVLRETERLGQVLAEQGEPNGAFRLGVIPSLSSTLIPLFLPRFLAAFTKVALTLEELTTERMLERLRADTLEAGILAIPLHTPGVHEESLGLEAMSAYLPPADPRLKKQKLSHADLSQGDLFVMSEGHCFRTQVLSYCKASLSEREGHVRFESGNFETLVRLVDQGLGSTVLPALVAQGLSRAQALRLRPLVSPSPLREIGLVTSRHNLRRKVNEVLASILREELSPRLKKTPRRGVVLEPLPAAPGK